MKLWTLRVSVLSVVAATLVAALIGAALPSYGEGFSPAVVKDRSLRSPSDDFRLPGPSPIKPPESPGFPSELAGKCRTMQDCLEYCKAHPSEYGCRRFFDKPVAPTVVE